MKIILNEEEKECIENTGYLLINFLIGEDFIVSKPYKVVREGDKLIIKKR